MSNLSPDQFDRYFDQIKQPNQSKNDQPRNLIQSFSCSDYNSNFDRKI